MNPEESASLTRECEAVQIPSGLPVRLSRGTRVRLRQSLGGTYTVVTEEGCMARIAGKDADALGIKPELEINVGAGSPRPSGMQGEETSPLPSKEEIEKSVWDQLRTVFDPEIPVNVVDLGLVYLCEVKPLPEDKNNKDLSPFFEVHVKMTLTAPGCGMGSVLQADAQGKILKLPGVKRVNVEMVVDPPWNPSRMSEAAKLQLGMF